MRVWSIQPVEVYENILKTGHYRCEEKYVDEWWKEPYNWLATQMIEKIGHPPEKVKYPVWAWHTRNWKHKKPDLRNNDYGKKGERLVCIELEVPDNEIVLTDFDAWHFVLNKWYLNTNCWDEDTFDKDNEWLDSLSHSERERIIEESWKGVFNIDPKENDWCARGKWIQATFWQIKKDYIKSAQCFKIK